MHQAAPSMSPDGPVPRPTHAALLRSPFLVARARLTGERELLLGCVTVQGASFRSRSGGLCGSLLIGAGMDLAQQQEQFSFAFVQAVASVAGVNTARPRVDEDSVDVHFSVHRDFLLASGMTAKFPAPQMDAQPKTCRRDILRGDGVHFPLEKKNYDDLRATTCVPRILIVVLLPKDLSDWLVQRPDELALRHSAWWMSLRGMGPTENTSGVTVTLPRTQGFCPDGLTKLLAGIAEGAL